LPQVGRQARCLREGKCGQRFANDFVVGESATSQISHTKGGVLDGIVAFEGSTNWSSSGEGTGISLTAAKQAPGFKAQNNTLAVYVNTYEIAKFAARLDYEHAVAAAQKQPVMAAAAAAAEVVPSSVELRWRPL